MSGKCVRGCLMAGFLVAGGVLVWAPPALAAGSTCTVNGVSVTGYNISGTDKDDTIVCSDGVSDDTRIETYSGNDTITITAPPGVVGNAGAILAGFGGDHISVTGGNGAAGNTGSIRGESGTDYTTVTGGNGGGIGNTGYLGSESLWIYGGTNAAGNTGNASGENVRVFGGAGTIDDTDGRPGNDTNGRIATAVDVDVHGGRGYDHTQTNRSGGSGGLGNAGTVGSGNLITGITVSVYGGAGGNSQSRDGGAGGPGNTGTVTGTVASDTINVYGGSAGSGVSGSPQGGTAVADGLVDGSWGDDQITFTGGTGSLHGFDITAPATVQGGYGSDTLTGGANGRDGTVDGGGGPLATDTCNSRGPGITYLNCPNGT